MMANRVYHWKHGWIPLDSVATAEKKMPQSDISRPTAKDLQAKPDRFANTPVKASEHNGITRKQIAGVPMWYEEPSTADVKHKLSDDEIRELADVVHRATKDLPNLGRKPIRIHVESVDQIDEGAWGVTASDGDHGIAMNENLWTDFSSVIDDFMSSKKHHFGITGEVPNVVEFRKAVLTHEIGHVIHLRGREKADKGEADLFGYDQYGSMSSVDQFANSRITPADLGFHVTTDPAEAEKDPTAVYSPTSRVPPVQRWAVDSLHRRTTYALSNPFEWTAEAFTDAVLNGDKADPSSRRVMALMKQIDDRKHISSDDVWKLLGSNP